MRKKDDLSTLTVEQLVKRFIAIALIMGDALEDDDKLPIYNREYAKIVDIGDELKARGPEARRALVPLYQHHDPQVRLMAAQFSYGVAPEAARRCLEEIADSKMPPQYLHAGMSIAALDNGTSMLD